MPPDDGQRRGEEDDGLSDAASAYRKAAPYLSAAYTLVGAVGLFTAAGWWLDKKVGTEKPWFMIGGSVLGMVGGFIGFFRQVLGKRKP